MCMGKDGQSLDVGRDQSIAIEFLSAYSTNPAIEPLAESRLFSSIKYLTLSLRMALLILFNIKENYPTNSLS